MNKYYYILKLHCYIFQYLFQVHFIIFNRSCTNYLKNLSRSILGKRVLQNIMQNYNKMKIVIVMKKYYILNSSVTFF